MHQTQKKIEDKVYEEENRTKITKMYRYKISFNFTYMCIDKPGSCNNTYFLQWHHNAPEEITLIKHSITHKAPCGTINIRLYCAAGNHLLCIVGVTMNKFNESQAARARASHKFYG